jgi:chromosome segregation ATPase
MATYEERQSAALSATVAWLEDELREAKTLIVKQQQALDQLSAQLWEVTSALHKAEDVLATLPPRLEVLPEYDTQLRQLKDDLNRVHEQGLATEGRLNDLVRVRQSESERDRAVLNDHSHRLEAAERGIAQGLPRFDALDEASRRSMESVTAMRQRVDELDRQTEGLDGRLTRLVEAGGRTEQEFGRLNGEVEALHRQDTTMAERLQIYTELLKRLEAQISVVSSEVAVKQDVMERIDLLRVERQRLEERVSVLEAITADLRESDDDMDRRLSMLDGRDKGFNDRLVGLQSELAHYRAVVTEQFQRLHQSQERMKRRQIEDLEREIREMRIHAFRPVEE